MADILQTQYCSIFSDPNSRLIEQTLVGISQGDPCSIQDIDFDKEDIIKAIDELDVYAATSHDDIPAKIIKYCKHSISTPLTLLWKWSMETALIPFNLKRQFVAPIYKKGDKTDPTNYRLISLTSHQIKVFERVMRNRMVVYLESNVLLSGNQHGFRKGRSCLTQLLQHCDEIFRNMNAGYETDVIYLDYAKAFDKVVNKLLLQKLKAYGITGRLYQWIR